jgi:photosystem II stability/assembly factor-like uncharacterized protein
MKRLVFIFAISLFISLSTKSFSQIGWMAQQSGTSAYLNNVFFINNQTGWICGLNGFISRTTNGGINWIAQVSNCPNTLYALYFLNENTGWAAGGYININTWGYVNIIKTTNGGLNWFSQKDEPSNQYYPQSLYFFDVNTGFASCQGNNGGEITGTLLKTTNGGTNWFMMSGSKPTAKTVFINNNTAFCISKVWSDYNNIDTALIYKTTNGGQNWSTSFRKYLYTFNDIKFFNQNTGIVLGRPDSTGFSYRYFKTTDAGNTWNLISIGTYYQSNFCFNNEMTGWATGSNIYRTINGGVNWIESFTNPSSSLNYITFTDSFNGWAVGYNGLIYRTIVADTISGNYFPLQVGNVYKYYAWNFPYPNNGTYFKARITKDTIAFGKRYFYCYNIPSLLNGWVRYDSASGLLLHLYPNNGCGNYPNDKIIDSLTARFNNTLNYCTYNIAASRRCSDTSNVTLFGYYTTKRKAFAHDGLIVSDVTYARNIGIANFDSGEPPPVDYYVDLKGCYVNGIMYGDTIITTVSTISNEVPSDFTLSQNYPNPFNQSTIFNFQCSMKSHVTISVYDITGREVQKLVNEILNPGVYNVRFDGSGLNSGVYFYRMTTDGYSETKKMILMK